MPRGGRIEIPKHLLPPPPAGIDDRPKVRRRRGGGGSGHRLRIPRGPRGVTLPPKSPRDKMPKAPPNPGPPKAKPRTGRTHDPRRPNRPPPPSNPLPPHAAGPGAPVLFGGQESGFYLGDDPIQLLDDLLENFLPDAVYESPRRPRTGAEEDTSPPAFFKLEPYNIGEVIDKEMRRLYPVVYFGGVPHPWTRTLIFVQPFIQLCMLHLAEALQFELGVQLERRARQRTGLLADQLEIRWRLGPEPLGHAIPPGGVNPKTRIWATINSVRYMKWVIQYEVAVQVHSFIDQADAVVRATIRQWVLSEIAHHRDLLLIRPL